VAKKIKHRMMKTMPDNSQETLIVLMSKSLRTLKVSPTNGHKMQVEILKSTTCNKNSLYLKNMEEWTSSKPNFAKIGERVTPVGRKT